MKKNSFIVLLFLLCLFLIGCGMSGNESEKDTAPSIPDNSDDIIDIDVDRKIYYTVSYTVKLKEIEETISSISKKVSEYGGYIEKSSEWESDSKSYASYTYRVPISKLNDFLNFMEENEGIASKNISSDDITLTYSKTEERLKTLNASKNAYLKMLEKENLSISDIISINTRIEEIDTEVNYLENTKAKYDSLLDYATININYNTNFEKTFLEQYLGYLVSFFITFGKVILYALPFVLVAGVIMLFIFIPQRKKNKEQKGIKDIE